MNDLPDRDHRRTTRVRPGLLRVLVDACHEGVLIDISSFGALVHLDAPQSIGHVMTMELEWERSNVWLRGRVVWASADPEATRTVWAEGYSIAIEFEPLTTASAAAVRRMLSQRPGSEHVPSAAVRSTDRPITTYRYKEYEYDVELTPVEASPGASRFEARVTRIERLGESGVGEPLDARLFGIATGRDQDEATLRIQAAVQSRVGS